MAEGSLPNSPPIPVERALSRAAVSPPRSWACPRGCEGLPRGLPLLSLATLCCRHQFVPLCLPEERSMGAPEDRSSLTHPCVPKAPGTGSFHHCPGATSNQRGSCSWERQEHAGPQPGSFRGAARQHHLPLEPQDTVATGQHCWCLGPAMSTQDKSHSPSAPLSGSSGSDLGFSHWLKATQWCS